MIGRTVSHYEVCERLGGGGMGEVFKAWDARLDRYVALKFLPPALGRHGDARERFVREAKAASSLDHPNLCVVHDVGETEDGQLYICMAYIEGESVKDRLTRGPMPIAEAAEVATQVARGLSRAHEAGIIHRDLKPANVMLTPRGEAKIVDFGLAKLVDEEQITRPGATVGTFRYMSPEQARGEKVDHRSDLWSLGVVLFEMMAGRAPFVGEHGHSVQRAIVRDPVPPLDRFRPEVPRGVVTVVERLLAKEPSRRFQSAGEVVQALSQASRGVADGLATATATSVISASAAAAARQARPALVLGALGLVVALLVGVLIWRETGLGPGSGPQQIAVLPFENFTGDPGRDYVCDGLAAGLITSLSEVAGLQVVSRAEAWAARGRQLTATQIAGRLGVEALLGGSVRSDGDDLVVDTELIDRGGGVLWSQVFRGPAADILGLERQIAQRLTRVLEIPLSRRERTRLGRNPTSSYQAYDFYLRGREELERFGGPGSAEVASEMFRQAIRLDEKFALAYCGLSEVHWLIAQRDHAPARLEEAEAAARRALEIDPELPAAHVAIARILRVTGRASESIAELERVLSRHPKPDEAHRELAMSLEQAGDLKGAEGSFQGAVAVAPDYWYNWNALGAFLYRMGRYEEAERAFGRAVELAPPAVTKPQENLATLEVARGRFDAAIAIFEQWNPVVTSAVLASNIGTAYFFSEREDRLEKSEKYFRLAVGLAPNNDELRRNLGDVLLMRGREDEAQSQFTIARELVEKQLETNPESHALRLRHAFYAAKASDCSVATETMAALRPELPEAAQYAHQAAYVYALCGERSAAIERLRTAIALGVSPDLLRGEQEFAELADDPDFEEITRPASPR